MKLLIVCPIPVEYKTCRQVLSLREISPLNNCRMGRKESGNLEVLAIESGPAKARTAAAVASAIMHHRPDLIIDSGSCGGLEPGITMGQIIIAESCYEYDITGSGLPRRVIPEMILKSALSFMPTEDGDLLQREAVEAGREEGYRVRVSSQACGEFLVADYSTKQLLYSLFHASGCNWETAGVFVPVLRSKKPPLSFRIVTDLGDSNALSDFRSNVKIRSKELYSYLNALIETGWFNHFCEVWQQLGKEVLEELPASVKP